MRFCSNWQIYADDITIRSGRWIDGVYHSDGESAERLREAQKQEKAAQPLLADAFKALGFGPSPLGVEKDGKQGKLKKRPKTKSEQAQEGLTPESAGDPSPYAHWGSVPPSSEPSLLPAADAGLFTPRNEPSALPAVCAGECVHVGSSQRKSIPSMHKSPYCICARDYGLFHAYVYFV